MKRNTRKFGLALAALTLVALLFSVFGAVPARAAYTWTVDASFANNDGCNTTTLQCKDIQAAITAASNGDTINVAAGTYSEQVIITYPTSNISLVGAGRDNTTIDAGSTRWGAIDIQGASHITISGFTLRNRGAASQDDGINIVAYGFPATAYSTYITVEDCTMDADEYGIRVHNSSIASHNIFRRNIITSDYSGIHLEYTSDNTITQNTISGAVGSAGGGIKLSIAAKENTVQYNQINGCRAGVSTTLSQGGPKDNIFRNNEVSNNGYGIEWLGGSGWTLTENNIFSNTTYNFYTTMDVVAENNWWGQDPPDTSKFYVQSGKTFDYTPWSTGPHETTPPPTEVWVDAVKGNDSNPGTQAEPFATIQKGVDTVASGGTVNVAAGTYIDDENGDGDDLDANEGGLVADIYKSNLTLQSTAGAAVTIIKSRGTEGDGAVRIRGVDVAHPTTGVTVDGFTVLNTGTGNAGLGLLFGASFAGDMDHPAVDNTVQNCIFGSAADQADSPTVGVYLWGADGNHILNNEFYQIRNAPSNQGNAIIAWGGLPSQAPVPSRTNLIEGNVIHSSDRYGIFIGAGDMTDFSNTRILGNNISNTAASPDLGFYNAEGPIYVDGDNSYADYMAYNVTELSISSCTDDLGPVWIGADRYLSISAAVTAAVNGNTINVAAGTYVEQLEITKNLTLQGAGSGTVIQSPDTLTKKFTTSADNYPIVYMHDADDVTIQDLVVDGAGKGNANNRSVGIGYHNAGGTVDNVEIKDVRNTPFSGAQHGVALYAYNDDDTARTLTVSYCNIHDFQKNGMALSGEDLTVDVNGNTVVGYGATTTTAQNGIQVSYGAAGTIGPGNNVSGISYTGSGWAASSILVAEADVDVEDNTVTDGQMGLYYIDGSGTISGNTITADTTNVGGVSFWAIAVCDPEGYLPSPFEEGFLGALGDAKLLGGSGTMTVQVEDNVLTGTPAGGANTSYGLEADAGWGTKDLDFTATRNTITGWDVGVEIYECQSSCADPKTEFVGVDVNQNSILSNGIGLRSNTDDLIPNIPNAENNWWGDASGPEHSANPGGTGDKVEGEVDYDPWLGYVSEGADLQALIDAASPGDVIPLGPYYYEGGFTIDESITLQGQDGTVIGPGSPVIVAAVDVVLEDTVYDGDPTDSGSNSSDPGIFVQAGADNLTVQNCEIKRWEDGIEVAGDVTSLKVVGNWIHDNTDAGLQVDSGVSIVGVVTIEGNLFKVNGTGIRNDGTNNLKAQYNSWGAFGGPGGGDTAGATAVDTSNFTFAEVFLDVDPLDPLEKVQRNVNESEIFDVALKVDAAKLYGLTFKFTYDTTMLTFNSPPTFASTWDGRCTDLGSGAGTIHYRCNLLDDPVTPDPEYDANGGTLASFNFTATPPTPATPPNGPWTTYFNIAHAEADTSAGAVGAVKVYVNNAGFGDASSTPRDITGSNDGQIDITGIAQFTGFVDLQGRTNDSGATIEVYEGAAKTSTKLADATNSAGGGYTTSYTVGNLLTIGTTYYFQVDAPYYLPTTGMYDTPPVSAPSDWDDSGDLTTRPLTTLANVKLLGGDCNDDNYIDYLDAGILGPDFGNSPPNNPQADVNADGTVNILDAVLLGGNWHKSSSPWTPTP